MRSPCGLSRSGRGRAGPTGRRGSSCRRSLARTMRRSRWIPCSSRSAMGRSRRASCRSCWAASSGRCGSPTASSRCASANARDVRSGGNSTPACCPSRPACPIRSWRRCARQARRCPIIWRPLPTRTCTTTRACILLLIPVSPRPPAKPPRRLRLAPSRAPQATTACIFLLIRTRARATSPHPAPLTRCHPAPLRVAAIQANFRVMPPSTTSSRPVT